MWAGVLIGVAIAFKLQAVFMLPVLVLVAVHQQVTWKRAVAAVSAVPVTFVVSLLPAWLAGASISQLASIYPAQISGDGTATTGTRGAHGGGPGGGFGSGAGLRGGRGGGGGTVTTDGFGNSGSSAPYTENAANFYQWLPSDAGVFFTYLGLHWPPRSSSPPAWSSCGIGGR